MTFVVYSFVAKGWSAVWLPKKYSWVLPWIRLSKSTFRSQPGRDGERHTSPLPSQLSYKTGDDVQKDTGHFTTW